MTDDLRTLLFGFTFACAFLVGGVHAAETCFPTTGGHDTAHVTRSVTEYFHAP